MSSKKEVKSLIKLLVPAGAATPAPPVGSTLGQHGLNIMNFCKEFNNLTMSRKGEIVPVLITIYKDKTFTFVVKATPTVELIKKKVGCTKGSSKPNETKVGVLKQSDLIEIAKIKMEDLNTRSLEQSKKIIAGTARSMGIDVAL